MEINKIVDKLLKNRETMLKNRDKLLKNRQYLSIVVYFILFFMIDYSGFTNLYNESFIRRLINMHRRIDPLSYRKKIKPYCEKYDKMLNKDDIVKMQSINIPETTDVSVLTRKNTTTHQMTDDWSEKDKNIINTIHSKVQDKYEKQINKKLYKLSKNATIYRYHGKNSHHLWHVDPRNIPEIYNIIICIKKKGNISPLQYKDKDGIPHSIHFEEGDAALFNGGTTVHQVPPNNDPNSERTVLSLAYTSDKNLSEKDNVGDNMCTYIEGGNNYKHISKLIITAFIINFILTQISGINKLSYKSLLVFIAINMIIAKYLPYYDIGTGTNRSSSIYHNILTLIAFMLATVSIKGAIVFFSYFLLSDLFFPRKWVEYD